MNRKWLALIPIALCLVACKGRTLDGKWNVSGTTIPGTENADATFKGENVDLHIVANVSSFKIDFTGHGKYKLNGDKYSVNFSSIDLGTKVGGSPEVETSVKQGLQQYLNKDANGTLQWTNDNTVTIAFDGGQTMTLTRQ